LKKSFLKYFFNQIESKLDKSKLTFIWDYPIELQALSKEKKDAPHLCERFELYWKGLELANCFGELLDPDKITVKCKADLAERARLGKDLPPIDEEFIEECAKLVDIEVSGIALGLDRLIQCIIDARDLKSALPFATM